MNLPWLYWGTTNLQTVKALTRILWGHPWRPSDAKPGQRLISWCKWRPRTGHANDAETKSWKTLFHSYVRKVELKRQELFMVFFVPMHFYFGKVGLLGRTNRVIKNLVPILNACQLCLQRTQPLPEKSGHVEVLRASCGEWTPLDPIWNYNHPVVH